MHLLPKPILTGIVLSLAFALGAGATEKKTQGQRLMDFNGASDEPKWTAQNDVVMGGISTGEARTRDGTTEFSGNLSLKNNGGFAQVHTEDIRVDLSDASGIRLRVKGDGRTYQLRLGTDARYRGDRIAYGAEFATKAGEWTEVTVPVASMVPSHHGNVLDGPPINRAKVEEIGLLLGDGQPGPFALEVDWIRSE